MSLAFRFNPGLLSPMRVMIVCWGVLQPRLIVLFHNRPVYEWFSTSLSTRYFLFDSRADEIVHCRQRLAPLRRFSVGQALSCGGKHHRYTLRRVIPLVYEDWISVIKRCGSRLIAMLACRLNGELLFHVFSLQCHVLTLSFLTDHLRKM